MLACSLESMGVRPAVILTAQLALPPGTRIGVYDITASTGEGGMGQVSRATDTKLNVRSR